MTKALLMTGFLTKTPKRKEVPLMGGIGMKPLTAQEVQWAKERKKFARQQKAIKETIARIRAERSKETAK